MATSRIGQSIPTNSIARWFMFPSTCRYAGRHAPRGSKSRTKSQCRCFSSTSQHRKASFSRRLRDALSKTPVIWYPIPATLGIGFLGAAHFYRVREREKAKRAEEDEEERAYLRSVGMDGDNGGGEGGSRPKKRPRTKPSGPWQVQVMSTLPLKAVSRLWGRFNELEIPYYLRVPGFKLYSWIFGVK